MQRVLEAQVADKRAYNFIIIHIEKHFQNHRADRDVDRAGRSCRVRAVKIHEDLFVNQRKDLLREHPREGIRKHSLFLPGKMKCPVREPELLIIVG